MAKYIQLRFKQRQCGIILVVVLLIAAVLAVFMMDVERLTILHRGLSGNISVISLSGKVQSH